MPSAIHATLAIGQFYESAVDDPGFDTVAKCFSVNTAVDSALAELIEADGRERIRRNRPVELGRYLQAVADLPDRIEPLDAAIDMTLRWLAKCGSPDRQSVDMLIRDYPQLGDAIRESAALSNAIWSTTNLQTGVASTAVVKQLPCEFGPTMPDGRSRYELQRLLGEGAFGKVYLATDRQLSDTGHEAAVSIKVFAAGDMTPWARQRFIEEATKARRIDHPNVVRVLDRGVTDEDEEFIVYEFVEGGDLARWSRRQRRPIAVRSAVSLAADIARGVHAAHMAGLVHCDLKPGNIMMTADGRPKVADFGIAIRASEQADQARREAEPQPRGNIAFISPEQYRLEPGALTVPSDIYALGGMLFWLLTDQLPHGSTPEEIEAHHATGDPPRPVRLRDSRRETGADLEAICLRAMASDPKDRHASALAMADDLDAWARHEPIRWTNPSTARRLRLWTARKPALATALVVIALLAALGGVAGIVANHQRVEAEMRRIEAEMSEARNEAAKGIALTLRAKLKKDMDAGITTDLLPMIWAMEWFFGPQIMGDPAERPDFWSMRYDIVRNRIAQAGAAGGGDDIETLLWKSTLACWLVSDGDVAGATVLLDEVQPRVEAIAPAGDQWPRQLVALRSCAAVMEHATMREGRVLSEVELERLRGSTETLEAAAASFDDGIGRGGPVHMLVLQTLRTAYGPTLLDQPQRAREVAMRHKELDEN